MKLTTKNKGIISQRLIESPEVAGRKLVIAIDFDGTLVEKDCWKKYSSVDDYTPVTIKSVPSMYTSPNMFIGIKTVDIAKMYSEVGHTIIMWTCRIPGGRPGLSLEEAVEWCGRNGLKFDAVNDDVDWSHVVDHDVPKGRKIIADRYIDDKSCDVESISAWNIRSWRI